MILSNEETLDDAFRDCREQRTGCRGNQNVSAFDINSVQEMGYEMSLGRRAEQFQHTQACIRVCCCSCLILAVHIILSLNNQLSRIQDKEQISSHFFSKACACCHCIFSYVELRMRF